MGARAGEDVSDAELVARAGLGDPGSFDLLVSRHLKQAVGFAYRMVRNREDAEDLVQESFLTVLEKIETFDSGRAFKPWYYRILANRCLNHRRSAARRLSEELPASAASRAPAPDRVAARAELGARLRTAMDELPERQRTVLQLSEVEGFAGSEIAGVLGLSEGTVRWHLHQARERMRELLSGWEHEVDGVEDGLPERAP
ncbi:MAG: RNA polymerase sigma factor [Longimicrobiaceae bacterium]